VIVQSHARVLTLHPGDVALGQRGDRLQTLLGSCVAIVLTDPKRTVGVMCHIVHAMPSTDPQSTSCAYADVALRRMVSLLQSCGITASMCDAYVFGGGNMFPRLVTGRSVGDRNVDCVLAALSILKARVLSVDVGGAMYRQLDWLVGPDAPQAVAVPL
jgi:chemotaxis protein CheD